MSAYFVTFGSISVNVVPAIVVHIFAHGALAFLYCVVFSENGVSLTIAFLWALAVVSFMFSLFEGLVLSNDPSPDFAPEIGMAFVFGLITDAVFLGVFLYGLIYIAHDHCVRRYRRFTDEHVGVSGSVTVSFPSNNV